MRKPGWTAGGFGRGVVFAALGLIRGRCGSSRRHPLVEGGVLVIRPTHRAGDLMAEPQPREQDNLSRDQIRSPYRIRGARRIGYEAPAADLHSPL